ncbi:MAG: thymidine phosphorylase, partial [Silvanigrellales bacterium]|nr:thymidine phosphorylase [Silvanigrellales bacterium]
MIPQEIIRKKRDGHSLSREEIASMVKGLVEGVVPSYQMSALLMAIYFNGCSAEETAWLLDAMVDSGTRYDWSDLRPERAFVDKHSTGGVGDKSSLVILPLLIADGLDVPMIAGRGLGHTGGTLDKLESLPGLRTQVPADTYRAWVRENHGAFGAQTSDFVPADKMMYALRDVTSTVESIPLIVASIMSKKIAEGLDALVLDVKFGSGSFMGSLQNARELAEKLVDTGRRAGCRVSAALTNMDEPLGRSAGNALEVLECLDVLQGAGPLDTRELSLQLAARVACDARGESSEPNDAGHMRALGRMKDHLLSGRAYEIFVRTLILQGASRDDVERRTLAWTSAGANTYPLFAPVAGRVRKVNTRNLGLAILELGGGRKRVDDTIHPGVGLSGLKKRGEEVGPGEPLCYVHAANNSD